MSKPCKKPASDCLFAPWYFLAKQFKDHGLAFVAYLKSDPGIYSQEPARKTAGRPVKSRYHGKKLAQGGYRVKKRIFCKIHSEQGKF